MDRKHAAAALLALAACIACSAAAPTASNQTALELMDGPTEGCYYNFQHYGEGDRIMTNEPCLNCTCHNRMLMCYLRVCPFTKPIGQDCTVEKRADQCCPIVTCPDVPVDLLTSTSTSSPAEYGTTGIGKLDKYGCSINGKYFSEGSKVPSTPNKPCEHCYCIRNMTTCVMQECTLHVDGCTPIYHKDVCCPVRYSCDHPEDDILLLDDMTTTVRPTPGFLLTTTTAMPVTQISQDCVHDDQIFPDGTLIKTEKACEHCYCMKGDIVCVVQECGTPMENEGKNCTSLPPRHGQCCPDTYICEGDDRGTELTTEITDQFTQPPRRVGVEGSGYRNEPDEIYTEKSTFETDIEGSGEDYSTDAPVITVEDVITEKIQPDIIDEILLATTEKEQIGHITEPDKDQNTIPDIIPGTESSDLPETIAQTTEANVKVDLGIGEISPDKTKTTVANEYETPGLISKEDDFITTESPFRKEDNNIVSDEILTIKEQEKLPTTPIDLVDEIPIEDEHLDASTDSNLPSVSQSTTISTEYASEVVNTIKEKDTTTEEVSLSSSTERNKSEDEPLKIPEEDIFTGITTMAVEKTDKPETTTANPEINEVDENILHPGRIPGEGDCLLNGITYRNNTIVPSSNNCHTSCKCISSIIKCDPIICSSPPEYMENMNDCQPIYDSPDACCPTYVCSAKETIPPQSHSQMSGTESPKPITESDCNGPDCRLDEDQKPISEPSSSCTSVECLSKPGEKQDIDKIDCGLNGCANEAQKPPINQDCSEDKCQILPVVACEGENCLTESVPNAETDKTPIQENEPSLNCDENGDCKVPEHTQQDKTCKDETCIKQEHTETEVKAPLDCIEPECITNEKPGLPSLMEQSTDLAPEKISTDKVTEIIITELDKETETPVKMITTIIDENITENPTPQVTKLVEIIPSEDLDVTTETSSDGQGTTHKTDLTESLTTQNIPEKHDDTKIPEQTTIEHLTESSGSQEVNVDEVTKEAPTDQTDLTESQTTQNIPEKYDYTKIPEQTSIEHITEPTGLQEVNIDEVTKEAPTDQTDLTESQTTQNIPEKHDYTKIPEQTSIEHITESTGSQEEMTKEAPTDQTDLTESLTTQNIPEKHEYTKIPEQTSIEYITESTGSQEVNIEEVTKEAPTDQTDLTESLTTQNIPEIHDDTKIPEQTSIEHITESSGPQEVNVDEVTKEAPTDQTDLTEYLTTQNIPEIHDDTKIPEQTNIEHMTESSGSQEVNIDEVSKEAPTDYLTTDKQIIEDTSEHMEIKSEDKSTDKIEITTEHFDIFTDSNLYSTKQDEATVAQDSDNQKTGTDIPELDKNELEKLTPTKATIDASEKDPTITEVPEIFETKQEKTKIPETLETITVQTEKTFTDFSKATESYDGLQVTNVPQEQFGDTYTEKDIITEEPEAQAPHEITTDKNIADIADVTQPSESLVTKDAEGSTEKSVIVTESHIVPTELPQSMQTKLDEVTIKDVNQETVTDKHDIYTDSSDYFTSNNEETTSELSVRPIDNLPTTQIKSEVTEEPISEKVTTFTESPEILQTKTEDIMHEFGQPVTEKQEIYTKTPDDLSKTSDEDQKVDITVTASESDITKQEETFTESPKVHVTTLGESITKDYDIKTDSISTELPTLLTTLGEIVKITESEDKDNKISEEPITEKESHVSKEIINTTSETFREPTSEIDQHFTEKSEVAVTESTQPQTIAETDSYAHPSGEQNQVTTIKDNVIAQEITTIALEPITKTESQTKSPLLTDEKLFEISTEIQEELPLQTDVNEIDSTTHQSPKKPDESFTHPISHSEYTTEHYATESQKIHSTVMDESQVQLDSSTKASPFDHKQEESTDTSEPHEETENIFSQATTTQSEKGVADKETTLPIDSERTHDVEKTTASLISGEEKETETLSYTTESNINVIEQETPKTTGLIIDENVHVTTEESVSQEELLPNPTYENIPSEGVTDEIVSQTSHDISTENIKTDDATVAPIDMATIQPELFTKSEESSVTEITKVEKENEIITELPNSYLSSHDLSVPADKGQLDEDKQEVSTPSGTKAEEEKDVTKPLIPIVTDVDHITETSIPEKDEIVIESTTKISNDQTFEAEREPTVSNTYTTEPQKEDSEKAKDVTTQDQEITTDKIITIENSEYLPTSHAHMTTLPSFEEKPQQEIMTEKLADQTKPESDLQPTSSESTAYNEEDIPASTMKEEILKPEEDTTTPKSLEVFEKATSYSSDYQTTESVPKDDSANELPHKEIFTISPELLEPEKDDNEVTENIKNTSEINFDTVTEKEKSPEPVDIEAHTITTQRTEVDIVSYTLPETIPTDIETEIKVSHIAEHDMTEIPVFTDTQTSTVATKLMTEKQEVTETESLTKEIGTTESQYTTVKEQKESSTEASYLSGKEPEHNVINDQKLTTTIPEAVTAMNEDSEIQISQSTNIPYQPVVTTSVIDSQEQFDIKEKLTTFVTEDTSINIKSTEPTVTEKDKLDQPEIYSTQPSEEPQTDEHVTQKESDKIATESVPTVLSNVDITAELPVSTEKQEKPYLTEEILQATDSDFNLSETTPFLVELEEHTHRVVDEITTKSAIEEITTTIYETHASQIPERGDQIPDDISTFTQSTDEYPGSKPSEPTVEAVEDKEHPIIPVQEQIDEHTTVTPLKSEPEMTLITEKSPEPTPSSEPIDTKKDTTVQDDVVITSTTSQLVKEKDFTTESIEIQQTPTTTLADVHSSSEKDIYITSEKPLQPEISEETEEKLTPEIPKETTSKIEEEISTSSPPHIDNVTKPKEKPSDTTLRPTIPEVPKPEFIDDNVEVPSPDFPPSGGYGQEPDYVDEDQAFGPGTCRYGGKVYVSAQQIPRDDPCDFCFCFRSDIICLQQSCPPPIHGCHEEPIQGFCCPRYECPVSMATTMNVTTTTTTTTTTLPPHFLPHAYKGAAQRRGCQIKGHTYKVGEVVRASSGPCLHCTCGGDGQMKCDPKACTPEPMLRQMIAAAVSAKRRR